MSRAGDPKIPQIWPYFSMEAAIKGDGAQNLYTEARAQGWKIIDFKL